MSLRVYLLFLLAELFYLQKLSTNEVWPPERNDVFETSILCWSFADAAFWRGKDGLAMSEVATTARSIAASRFREA